jgi:hypothetical protein
MSPDKVTLLASHLFLTRYRGSLYDGELEKGNLRLDQPLLEVSSQSQSIIGCINSGPLSDT